MAAIVSSRLSPRSRRSVGYLVLTIMLVGGWAVLRGYQSAPAGPPAAPLAPAEARERPPSPAAPAAAAAAAPAAPAPSAPKAPSPPPEPMLGALAPPSVATLRAEVESNPHATPPSYLAWAAALSDDMEAADHDDAHARHTFGRLLYCLDGAPAETVAAVCLRHARELADRHPAWQEELRAREARLSGRIKSLIDD